MIRTLVTLILCAGVLCAGAPAALHAQPAPAAAPASASAPEPRIQMEHISVQVVGSGEPVIFIPGLSTPRAVWEPFVPDLAGSRTVYLVQVNGFGGDDPRGNLKPGILEGIVADLHRLIADRKLKTVPVVGHSLGGLAALMLAKAHPAEIERVLIVDAMPFVGSAFAPGSTAETIKSPAEAMRAQMASLYGKPFPDAMAQAIARQNALKPESQAQVAAWTAKADMRVSAQALYEDMLVDLRGDLKSIATPITVLVPWTAMRGEEATLAFYRREYAGAPEIRFTGVGDSGHFIMLDQPGAMRLALDIFLRRLT